MLKRIYNKTAINILVNDNRRMFYKYILSLHESQETLIRDKCVGDIFELFYIFIIVTCRLSVGDDLYRIFPGFDPICLFAKA